MKAWELTNKDSTERSLVFADTAGKAKAQYRDVNDRFYTSDLDCPYIEVSCYRLPKLDDMEKCSHKDICLTLVREYGWWFIVQGREYGDWNEHELIWELNAYHNMKRLLIKNEIKKLLGA